MKNILLLFLLLLSTVCYLSHQKTHAEFTIPPKQAARFRQCMRKSTVIAKLKAAFPEETSEIESLPNILNMYESIEQFQMVLLRAYKRKMSLLP